MPLHRKKALLDHAAIRAEKQGHRWTPLRADVYAALLDHTTPVTAYKLLEFLSAQHAKDMKPASVYRSLDALCELGLAVKIESLNAFSACRHPEEQHQHVFLVCDGCGHTDEIADHGIAQKLDKDASHHGFRTRRQVLELHGSCKDCPA